jgi:uncharacterized protein YggL (DUF469 family)
MKILSLDEMSKKRSRRLRKKLRIGEFQEMGVEIKILINTDFFEFDDATDKLIEYIESINGSFCGGGNTDDNVISGVVYRPSRGTLNVSDIDSLRNWMFEQVWIKRFSISKLVDMWHTDEFDF